MYNIIIDPGHGGIDSKGNYTTAPYKMHKFSKDLTAYEGALNRSLAGFLYLFCSSHPKLNVKSTIDFRDPRDLSLAYRSRYANGFDKNNTLFISVHCNASPQHNATGFEIYTSKGETLSDLLAEHIYDEVKPIYNDLQIPMRSDIIDGDHDKEADYSVLIKTKCPAVLIEYGFFDNLNEFLILSDPKVQTKLTYATFIGILKYLNLNYGQARL